MKKLEAEEKAIDAAWASRQRQLQDAFNLEIFQREADQIDAVTSSHEAFLDFDDLGVSVL